MAIQEYLINNLLKGFIVSSKAPFTSLVLFIYKSDRSLQFYIDYYKLNTLIKKNQYPLPLINKTLAWLSQAKCDSLAAVSYMKGGSSQ